MYTLILILILPFEWYLISTIFNGRHPVAKSWWAFFFALAVVTQVQAEPITIEQQIETVSVEPASSTSSSNSTTSTDTWGTDRTTVEITGALNTATYWTENGKSYHFSTSCPSLSRSNNILSGTLQDAINEGKTDPCNNCANGS